MENEKEKKELAKVEAKETAQVVTTGGNAQLENWMDTDLFNHMARVSAMLSKSTLVPTQYQGKPEDCMIAYDMASRMGVSPLMVMQNLYVVKGKPSWSGQACMAFIMASGKFKNVRHIFFGEEGKETRGCYVVATRKSTDEQVEGPKVSIAMAKAEGWLSNPKWKNMPELMLSYRAAAFFARTHCPEQLMGCQTVEEVEDVTKSYTAVENSTLADEIDEMEGD